MFTDPQSLTINGVSNSLPRILVEGSKSTYQKSDGLLTLVNSHINASGNRVRTMVRVDQKAVVPDPLTAVNDLENLAVYLVIDRPLVGFSATQVDQLVQALKAWLTTSAVTALYGREI